jgi:hypothetical protein
LLYINRNRYKMSKRVKSFRFVDPELIEMLDQMAEFENKATNGAVKITRTQMIRLLIKYGKAAQEAGLSIAKIQIFGK